MRPNSVGYEWRRTTPRGRGYGPGGDPPVCGECKTKLPDGVDSAVWNEWDDGLQKWRGKWYCDICAGATEKDMASDVTDEKATETAEPDMLDWLESQPTREEWLQRRLFDTVRPLVERAGYALPAARIACGWTGAGFEACTKGVCYDKAGSKAGIYEIFVSPAMDDPVEVVSTMLHEICHAIAGCEAQHDAKTYGKVAKALQVTKAGPDGKGAWPTQAWPSDELTLALQTAAKEWDEYPHASLNPPPPGSGGGGGGGGESQPGGTPQPGAPKQTTRLLKATCHVCGYTIRVTYKWASRGMPTCPCDPAQRYVFQLEKEA